MKKVTKSMSKVSQRRKDGRCKPNDGRGGGRKPGIKVLHVKSGKIKSHQLSWFLNELNRNRPAGWIDFNAKDWRSGWRTYIDDRQYRLVE